MNCTWGALPLQDGRERFQQAMHSISIPFKDEQRQAQGGAFVFPVHLQYPKKRAGNRSSHGYRPPSQQDMAAAVATAGWCAADPFTVFLMPEATCNKLQ